MKKIRRKNGICLFLALVLIAALMSGCGNSAKSTAASDNSFSNSTTPAEAPAAEPMTESQDYGYYFETHSDTAAPAEPAMPTLPNANVKLIYTANLSLETTEFDSTVSSLSELVAAANGYFEQSSLDNYSSYRYAYYTVRIPAESFDTFCTKAGELCHLTNISRSATDVSEEYYDTESRLTTQQTKLERLQELLSRAESMEDIITIESAISETELAIENLTGTLRHYDSLVGYSTVYIDLSEVYTLSEIEEPAIGFGAKLIAALKSGCASFGRGVQSLLLGIAYNWAGWLLFIVVVVVAFFLIRRQLRRRKARRYPAPPQAAEKKPEDKE